MGKKIVVGCLVFLGIAIVVGGLGGYFFVYKPVAGYYGQLKAQVGEIGDLNARVADRSPYTPPADNLLTPSQVERFVRVQRSIVERTGPHQEELRRKYRDLGGEAGVAGGLSGITGLFSIWTDLRAAFLETKEAQVEALNRENLSLAEYRWIRARFWEARDAGFASFDLERIADAVEERNPDLLTESRSPAPVPERNRELVAPYEEESLQWLDYAWLGL